MKNMTSFKRTVAAAAVTAALSISSTAFAGNNDGVLKGLIVDTAQAPIAGAVVTAKDPKTGFTRTTVVKADGSYRFSALPVGNYDITISKDGYSSIEQKGVRIKLGGQTEFSTPMAGVNDNVETIEISGSAMAVIDTSSAESALNIGEVELSRLPVARDVTSVALLAPGTTKGDGAFGNNASFGGASVAENAYFVNGLNVTNFRTGLGGSTIPFEFYKEFQVKTGGYSAEFGRSTGGVVNAVTKSGSNDWEYGANIYFRPDSLSEQSPNVLRTDGTMLTYNGADSFDKTEANIYLSGPLIEDTLFFYVLYNPRDVQQEYAYSNGKSFDTTDSSDAFWGAKVDWNINENHKLELTAFSDERETTTTTYGYDYKTDTRGDLVGSGTSSRGGDNISVKYTGYITDDFTLSALWGENEADLSDSSDADFTCPVVYQYDAGSYLRQGCFVNFSFSQAKDTREAFRIDGEYVMGDHTLRFGYDNETNTSLDQTRLSGPGEFGVYYLYRTYAAGATEAAIDYTFAEETDTVRVRTYATGGEFETLSSAFYIEDTWTISDDLVATIGLRSESFNNKNASGNSFIKVDNQIAPRLGISWDVNGDGESKVFANFGRYHLPIAANTNIRMAGPETYIHDYYKVEGDYSQQNADLTPILGEKLGTRVNGDGSEPDVREVLDTSIDPMYQDEFILGYEGLINDDWSWSVKGIYRNLGSVIDDITINKAITANGWKEPGHDVYVLTNPNSDIVTYYDTDGDGTLEQVNIAADTLGYPDPKRVYTAIDLTIKRQWDDVWTLDAKYTWSKSYGNAEGYVKSDNGQDDAGLTTDWDFPYLMDGAYGDLPNDRRHTFKVYGAYALTEKWTVGANLLIQSGRPVNGFGHGLPDGYPDPYGYGDTYYVAGNKVPRGSYGRTPWRNELNVNAKYTTQISDAEVSFQIDVFNVLGSNIVTEVIETAESAKNETNPNFLLPSSFQTPRYVQLSASVRF
jgi:hypothetical protein